MKVMQGLARHSTIALTARYTHMGLSDHTAAWIRCPPWTSSLTTTTARSRWPRPARTGGRLTPPTSGTRAAPAQRRLRQLVSSWVYDRQWRDALVVVVRAPKTPRIRGLWHGPALWGVCRHKHGQ